MLETVVVPQADEVATDVLAERLDLRLEATAELEHQQFVGGGRLAVDHAFTQREAPTALLNDLETLDKTYGIESMYDAGGMGMAMLVERLN